MKYHVHLIRGDGSLAPNPSTLYASGIAEAQRKAEEILSGVQSSGLLLDWIVYTVTEAH